MIQSRVAVGHDQDLNLPTDTYSKLQIQIDDVSCQESLAGSCRVLYVRPVIRCFAKISHGAHLRIGEGFDDDNEWIVLGRPSRTPTSKLASMFRLVRHDLNFGFITNS